MWQLPLPQRFNPVARYATAAALSVAGLALRQLLLHVFGTADPVFTFLWAVLVSAWLGGFWPGIVTLGLSIAGLLWTFLAPLATPRVVTYQQVFGLVMFALTGVIVCLLCEGFRGAVATSMMSAVRARASARDAKMAQAREKSILESITDGFIAYDKRWRITFVNSPAAELLGYRREELQGKSVAALFPNAVLNQLYPLMRRAVDENVQAGCDYSLPGSDRWFESVIYPSPSGASVFTREITDAKKLVAAVHESEARFRALADSAPLLIWTCNQSGERDYVNQPYLQFTGRTLEQECGEGWADRLYPGDRERVLKLTRDATEARIGFTAEYRLCRSDGEYRWMLDTGAHRQSSDGTSLGGVGSCLDITTRKQAEESLRENEAQLRLSMTVSRMGIWQYDVATGVATCSPEILRILLLPSRKVTLEDIVNTAHPDDRDAVAAVFARVIQNGGDYEVEYRFLRPGREPGWLLGRGQGTRAASGEVSRVIGLTIDISERKLIEDRVRHAQKLESLGILAGGIAHDFNNLLTGILGSASLVLEDLPQNSAAREMQLNVISASERAAQLTGQMLAYSGRGQFVSEPIDVSSLVRDNLKLIKPSMQNRSIDLLPSFCPELCVVEGDPSQIQQVAMNLILNATEAIPPSRPGKVRVVTSIFVTGVQDKDVAPGEYVCLRVEDDGAGMDQATIARIFDPFFTTKFTGRGLGLAAVQGIVHGHKGAIRVTSTPGEGTCFEVLLPRAFARAPIRNETRDSWRGYGAVLVVDDEETVRLTAQAVLQRYGFEVVCAHDGAQAIEIFVKDPDRFAAVLLDMTMPVMGGAETLHRLRAVRPNVKVIATTGYSEGESKEKFAADGLDGFIQKPYSGVQLASAVRIAISGTLSSAAAD